MFPNTIKCPISQAKHRVVYRDNNKDTIIDYCNRKIAELNSKPSAILLYAIGTEGKAKFSQIDDLGIIQFAQIYCTDTKFLGKTYNTNYLYHANIRNGFIVIEPDNEIKETLTNLFNHPKVYKVFFNISRNLTVLFNNGIKFDQNIIDTQAITSHSMNCNYSMKDTIDSMVTEGIDIGNDAKILFYQQEKIDFSERLVTNINLSDEEAFKKYGEILQHASNDILFTCMSFFHFFRRFGSIRKGICSYNNTKVEQFMYNYNNTNPLYTILSITCATFMNLIQEKKYKSVPYQTLALIYQILPFYDLIRKTNIHILPLKQIVAIKNKYKKISKRLISSSSLEKTGEEATLMQSLIGILDEMKITGQLREVFINEVETSKDYTDASAAFEHLCSQIDSYSGLDPGDTIELFRDLKDYPDDEREAAFQEIYSLF